MNQVTARFLEVYNHLLGEKSVKNLADFAKKIGVSTSMLTEISKGRSNVGLKAVQSTVQRFGDVNSAWLLTGQGEMLKSLQLANAIEDFENKADINDLDTSLVEVLSKMKTIDLPFNEREIIADKLVKALVSRDQEIQKLKGELLGLYRKVQDFN